MTTFQKVIIFIIAVVAIAAGIFQAYSLYITCKTGISKYNIEVTR